METNTIIVEKNRYVNSKVYKLVDEITNHFYIGSTTSTLPQRLYWHKKNNQGNIKRHVDRYGSFNFIIKPIAEFNLSSKIQLLIEEDKIIQQHKDDEYCLNMNRAYLTNDEKIKFSKSRCINYKQNHKDQISDYNRSYRLQNLDKIKERQHIKRAEKFTCSCGVEICNSSKQNHFKSKNILNIYLIRQINNFIQIFT